MTDLIAPLTQSEEFERTCIMLGLSVERFSTAGASCLLQSRKLPLIGSFHLVSRGPVANDPEDARALLRDVRRRTKGPLVVNASKDDPDRAGIRIAKGASLAMTDLMSPEDMRSRLNQKWRNQLKKAEASRLKVEDQPLSAQRHDWFLKAEANQQKSRGYRAYPGGFLLAFSAANQAKARLYSANLDGQPVAGMLVLMHGRMATYQAGVTTDSGRSSCAHNLLLWQIMCDLQSRGFSCLDLGRADLSPGLRRFKLGSGARIENLAGTYLSHHWFQSHRSDVVGSEPVLQSGRRAA